MDREFDAEEELQKIDNKIKDAQENLGDVEVRDFLLEKAQYFEKLNQEEKAVDVYNQALAKSSSVSKKMDIIFNILRISIKNKELTKIKQYVDQLKKLLEEGGDWEKKNRLKVYESIYLLMIRDFKGSASLLIDSITTFNSPEIISYNQLVFYTVLTSMVSLTRADIKKKIVHSPEILATIRELPDLKQFLEAFYKCDYRQFFISFISIIDRLQDDKYLAQHKKYYVREMRVVIYSQFLESYKTVSLEKMAQAFGIQKVFLDRELSELISSRRLNCKIDSVSGIVEQERIDERNGLYQNALKQGDILLNRIQKLSRFVDV